MVTTRTRTALAAALALALAGALALVRPVEAQEAPAEDECHASYTPCVPIAEDADCAGGEGDGPVYVEGPVEVIGPDDYGLDADGDGIGCEDDGTPPATTATTAPPAPEAAPAPPVEAQPTFTG